MKRYNYSKLIGKLKELGFTQEQFAKKIGISACSLNLTLNNKRNFRQDEIAKAATVLDLKLHEIEQYFLVLSRVMRKFALVSGRNLLQGAA